MIEERDAEIRRATVEECAEWLRRIKLPRTADWLIETMMGVEPRWHEGADEAAEALAAPSGPPEAEALDDSPTWPYVLAFARAMERKLAQNRHKGDREGWIHDGTLGLLRRLREEADELEDEIIRPATERDPQKILGEAADVANFAMFIADCYGTLDTGPQ